MNGLMEKKTAELQLLHQLLEKQSVLADITTTGTKIGVLEQELGSLEEQWMLLSESLESQH